MKDTAGNQTEASGNEFQPEVGSDYSDDGEYDHEDDEHHHNGRHSDEEHHHEKEKGHNNLKHISCLKNIHNESYCQGWKKATCDAKNRQVEIQEVHFLSNIFLTQARVLWPSRVEQGLEE